jgi:hypothetical protein
MLCDIKISDFCISVMEKDVGSFNISMNDVRVVDSSKPFENLVSNFPDFLLREPCSLFEVFFNLSIKVSLIRELHDNIESFRFVVIEGFLVRNDMRVLY